MKTSPAVSIQLARAFASSCLCVLALSACRREERPKASEASEQQKAEPTKASVKKQPAKTLEKPVKNSDTKSNPDSEKKPKSGKAGAATDAKAQPIEEEEDFFLAEAKRPDLFAKDESKEDVEVKAIEQAPPTDPPFFEVAPVSKDKFDLLVDSVFQKRLYDYLMNPGGVRTYRGVVLVGPSVGKPWAEWTENENVLVVTIRKLTLRFEHPESGAPSFEGAESFQVTLEFDDFPLKLRADKSGSVIVNKLGLRGYKLVVRHSFAEGVQAAAGLRANPYSEQGMSFYVPGQSGSGLVVIAPKSSEFGPRGLLLCPRQYDGAKAKRGLLSMETTPYKLVGVETDLNALSQLAVKTGFGPGVSESLVQVTNNLPASTRWYDRSELTFPKSTVFYRPEKAVVVPVGESQEITIGGHGVGRLHNSFGHWSEQESTELVTIKPVDIKAPMSIGYNKRTWKMAPGPCLGLVKERRTKYAFEKRELPEQMQAGSDLDAIENSLKEPELEEVKK
jgi:hypothetical protein